MDLAGGGAAFEIGRQTERDRVVATSMSNLGLERILAREGIELGRAAVATATCWRKCCGSNNALGGEQSGM